MMILPPADLARSVSTTPAAPVVPPALRRYIQEAVQDAHSRGERSVTVPLDDTPADIRTAVVAEYGGAGFGVTVASAQPVVFSGVPAWDLTLTFPG